MGRLIDADAIVEYVRKYSPISDGADLLETWLEDAPTVDAVEVVRCKDCKFYHRMTTGTGICKLACRHLGNDGFCSEGERKEGNGR